MTSTTLHGANPSEHGGAYTTPDFGDARAEFHALLSGCGLYDLSGRAKIAVTGSDRVRWLNGMATNNVRDLASGHGVYAFLLNAQGRIQADLYVFQRGESLLVDTERGQREKVLQLFDHYIIADDVEIADVSDKLTGLGLGMDQMQTAGREIFAYCKDKVGEERLGRIAGSIPGLSQFV